MTYRTAGSGPVLLLLHGITSFGGTWEWIVPQLVERFRVLRLDFRGHRDVFGNVVHAFQNPALVVIYLTGQVALGFHLSHALSGSLQSLGLEHPMLDRLFRGAGLLVAMLVVVGNAAIVLAIAFGLVRA